MCKFDRDLYWEVPNICEIILNLDQWFRSRCHSRYVLVLGLVAILFNWGDHLCNFCKGQYKGQFCEIILNLDQWF